MELKSKRVLKFLCPDCTTGFLQVPKLIKAVEELKAEVELLKANSGHTTAPPNESAITELYEMQKRSANLMIFNLPEAGHDTEDTKDLLKIMVPHETPTVLACARMGKRNKNGCRTLKVTLSNHHQVNSILKQRTRLKGKKVYVGMDLTQRQRDMEKEKRAELQDRLSKGESSLYLKYVNGCPVILQKNSN